MDAPFEPLSLLETALPTDYHAKRKIWSLWKAPRATRPGVGVPKDPIEAARLYRLAAGQRDPRAQSRLGLIFSIGEGVLKDKVESVR